MKLRTRRIIHHNVTAHPTAEWTLQQFREAVPGDHAYEYVIHDSDSIFSRQLDGAVKEMGVTVLRTPVRAPKANSICERFGGTLRRECLDFVIPINESHLRLTLKGWRSHYNRGRPHSSLGPACRNRFRTAFQPEATDTSYRLDFVLRRRPCSAACIMSIAS